MIQLDATVKFIHLNMFRATICPSSGVQSSELPHMMCSTGIAGCSRVELGRQLWHGCVWVCVCVDLMYEFLMFRLFIIVDIWEVMLACKGLNFVWGILALRFISIYIYTETIAQVRRALKTIHTVHLNLGNCYFQVSST
jgi:hypothetical protein